MSLDVPRTRHRALTVLPVTAALVDLAIVMATIALAAAGRDSTLLFTESADVVALSVSGPLIALGWVAVIAVRGGYQPDLFGAGVDEYKLVATSSALTAAVVGIGCYLAKYPLSRGFYVLAFAIGVPLLLLGRWVLRRAIQRARRAGQLQRRALIAGTADNIDEIATVLAREPWLGYDVVGALTPASDTATTTPGGLTVLANVQDIGAVVESTAAELVFFAGGGTASAAEMRHLIWALEEARVHVVVAPSVTDVSRERIRVRPVAGLPLVHVEQPRAERAQRWAKRSFDVLGALVLLLLSSPLFAVAALRVRRDGGPVIFRQQRVGRGGVRFACLKFRTMTVDAEERLEQLRLEQGQTGGLFKMREDPRVIPAGRWLRRYSIDELPQLVNVLRGEMSLVGPRPALPSELTNYDVAATRRLRVRPGLTGLWQVSGRSNLSWSETVRLDVYYVDNWSMLQDLSILVKTVRAVLRSDGAY